MSPLARSIAMALGLVACGPGVEARDPAVIAATDHPRSAPSIAPAAISAPAALWTAPSTPPPDPRRILDRYVYDVQLVETPPSAVFLIARHEEPATTPAACEAALRAYARLMGANQVHIDGSSPRCAGAVYMVQPRLEPIVREPGDPGESYHDTLMPWLHARWRRPPGIDDTRLQGLCTVTRIWTTSQLRILRVLPIPVRSSGDAAFDASVRALLDTLSDDNTPLPEPAGIGMARTVRGAMITVAFTGGKGADCR